MPHRPLTRKLLATGLSLSALAQLLPPLAPATAQALTPAGTPINNRATGTYEDPNNPGVQINATSNQVVVTVAEIAGLTNIPAGIIDANGPTVNASDPLNFDFLVTNTGNDPSGTNIFFPAIGDIVSQNFTITGYRLDLNNDGDFDDTDETVRTTAFTTTTPVFPNASVRVRVIGTIPAGTAQGATVSVRYGDTGANDNSAGTQNQDSTNLAVDVRTVNAGGAAPVNGEREAAAFQQTTVGQAVNNQALATILKTNNPTLFSNNNTPTTLTDDRITYDLSLRVEGSAGNIPGVTPANLAPTVGVEINGTDRNVILISDAIPVSTRLFQAPTAPTGWVVVYTNSPTGTNAPDAVWTTTAPSFPSTTTTRVGFVYDPNNVLATSNIAVSPAINAGTTFTGFRFVVETSGTPSFAGGGTINNIAQVFGRTENTNNEIYDESGDQQPSNYNSDGTVGPAPNNGVADPTAQGTDNANSNTGTGTGGEVNTVTITPPNSGILNGPNGVPGAVGPTNNNDDFTNKSAELLAGNSIPGTTYDPPVVTFNNTFQNPPGSGELDNVRLLPLPPATAGDIPDGTLVTIASGGQTATYTYNAGVYTLSSGATLQFDNLAGGTSINYTVAVDLPTTGLSVDRFVANGQARAGYDVPIVAFVDSNTDGFFQSGTETNNNITIDRVYTGYVRLFKQSQIIRNGAAVTALDDTNKDARPGDIIRYVVRYVNFSTPVAGSGNVTLSASNLVITEDGSAGGNTWGANSVHFNSATNSTGTAPNEPQNTSADQGTITFDGASIPDPATGTAVNVYVNSVGTIAPLPSATTSTFQGLFRFHRRVN